MSLGNRLFLPIILSALTVLAGCGSGGSGVSRPTPPPSGGFSNSNFNGTYTFSVAGANGNGVFAMAGTLVACGCNNGVISSGTVDINDPTGPVIAAALAPNSAYSISTDGRGTAQLFITPTGSSTLEIDLDFVLLSSSHGLVIRYDGFGTGSGTIDLQPAVIAQNSLAATPYAFMLSGADLNSNSLSTVGSMTLDSTGTITSGVEDFNYSPTIAVNLALLGSVTVGSGSTPGTASLNTTFGNLSFDVYPINSSHLKLIENDGQAVLVGDLVSQPSSAFPTGNLVFTTSGLDSNFDLFVTGGVMTSDGTSQITNGFEDVNDAGVVDNGTSTPFNFTGSFTDTGHGRFELDLVDYVGASVFAAYPSSGGMFMLEIDNGGVAGGVAVTQASGATVAPTQGYGLNMSGEDVLNFSELDEIAEFKTTATAMAGLVDGNDGGSLFTDNVNGTYSVDSNGFGSATFSSGGFSSMFFYAVDDSLSLFISTDPTQAALGSFEVQSTPVNDAHLSVGRSQSLPMQRVLPRKKSGTKKSHTTFKKSR